MRRRTICDDVLAPVESREGRSLHDSGFAVVLSGYLSAIRLSRCAEQLEASIHSTGWLVRGVASGPLDERATGYPAMKLGRSP
jgi:hypothetical protein